MDLSYSAADELFRKEIRSWLEREVRLHGAPPSPGDWDARRAYGIQRNVIAERILGLPRGR